MRAAAVLWQNLHPTLPPPQVRRLLQRGQHGGSHGRADRPPHRLSCVRRGKIFLHLQLTRDGIPSRMGSPSCVRGLEPTPAESGPGEASEPLIGQ